MRLEHGAGGVRYKQASRLHTQFQPLDKAWQLMSNSVPGLPGAVQAPPPVSDVARHLWVAEVVTGSLDH